MKKLIFVAIATTGLLLSANAQSIKFGAKAGANFANFTGEVEGAKIRTSFHVGGILEFKLSDAFSFQPELLYSSQGTREELNEGADIVTSKLDYLNIPLTAKFYLTDWLSIQAAPQIGFLLAAVEESDNAEIVTAEDLKELLKDIDFSLKLGAGYNFSSGLFVDAHYNLGLVNINDLTDDETRFKNGVIQLSLGYIF